MKPKVAVCISGHIRTWKQSVESWNLVFDNNVYDVDYFFHTWNENSHRIDGSNYTTGTELSIDEKHALINRLNPVDYMFEDQKDFHDLAKTLPGTDPNSLYTVAPGGPNSLYSAMMACWLKRKHERDNNIIYDICVKTRFDVIITGAFKLELPESIISTTLYTMHSGSKEGHRIGDIFYYSNSLTFDVISDSFRMLNKFAFWNFSMIDPRSLQLEHFMYAYAKMHNITCLPDVNCDAYIKILRDEKYFTSDRRGHETI